ncbi:hypothetical protein [Bacillus sp. M6-12]|nr:hypothetical protein [Bacillus sp. M6-12]
MKDKLSDIRIAMDKTVFQGEKFLPQHKQDILNNIKRQKKQSDCFPGC